MRIFGSTILLHLFLSGCDKSPQWKIYHQSDYETILIDEASIKRKDGFVSFWYSSELKSHPDVHFLWKEVYDCKKRKGMSLFYEVVKSIDTLPKNVPDLTDEDKWMDVTSNLWDSKVFSQLCEPTIKKTFF